MANALKKKLAGKLNGISSYNKKILNMKKSWDEVNRLLNASSKKKK